MSILQLVQLSAPWGRPLRNHSPSQEGGEALGGQACITLWSEWITAQAATRFQLLLHRSPNGCTVLMFWSAAVFADPAHHAHIAFHTCEPDLGWQAESMWGLKHGSGVTGVICAHTALYWSCSCQSVLKLKPCLLLSVGWLGSKASYLLQQFSNLLAHETCCHHCIRFQMAGNEIMFLKGANTLIIVSLL